VATSGMGKSTFLERLCVHLAKREHAVLVIDPHGTLAARLISLLGGFPPTSIAYLDFAGAKSVAYNPYDQPNVDEHGSLAGEFVHAFKSVLGGENFARMGAVLGFGSVGVMAIRGSPVDLPILLSKSREGELLRQRVMRSSPNPDVVRFFREFSSRWAEAANPIVARLSPLLLDERMRRVFSHSQDRVRVADAIRDGKVIIAAMPRNKDVARLVGGMLAAQFQHAAVNRSATEIARRRCDLIIDEASWFPTSATTLQTSIDEGRKFGLSVHLAYQTTAQIPDDLVKPVFSIPNIFVFGVNPLDAKQLANLFNGKVSPETLMSLRKGQVYAKIGQELVSFKCHQPLSCTNPDIAERILASSAQYYSEPGLTQPLEAERSRRVIETFEEE